MSEHALSGGLTFQVSNKEQKQERIFIAVVTAEYARKADFYDYFFSMKRQPGDVVTGIHGQSPAQNRNIVIEQALELEMDRVLFIDDDTVFQPDLLENLRKHDVDVVTGLMFQRNYPHTPLIFGRIREKDGAVFPRLLKPEDDNQLIEISAAGLGCCLIKTDVFRKIDPPWIRLGELTSDGWCDDIGFFKRARAVGIKSYCDLSQRVGHTATVTVWPNKMDGKWVTTYDSYGSGQLSTPQQEP